MRLLVVLVGVLAAAPAGAEEWMGVPDQGGVSVESGSRQVIRDATRRRSLDEGIPSDGAYARGIQLDAEGRHADALRAYGDALGELRGLSRLTARGCAPLWRAKIYWHREQSERLLEEEAYVSVMPTSALAHHNLGAAYHAKFLSIRAFLGRAPRGLWDKAAASYKNALAVDSRYAPARLGLAALYAEAGDRTAARAQLALVSRRLEDDALLMHFAAFYAAVGDVDAALATLDRAVIHGDNRRWAVRSNEFDVLRDHPQFKSLMAPSRLEAALLDKCEP
jgi:tetratricopeptide (TPR) repeat protein